MTVHPLPEAQRFSALAAAFVFALLFAASLWLPLAEMITTASGSGLDASNEAFLEAGRRASLKDMVYLTEILAVVEIVRSVEVGFDFLVSADVGVGKSISALAVLLERALFAALVGTSVYQVLLSLTEIAGSVKPALLEAVMFFGAAHFLVLGFALPSALRAVTRYLFDFVLIALFVLHLAVPYSVYATQWVSAAVTGELSHAVSDQIDTVHGDITHTTGDQTELQQWTKQAFVKKHYQRVTGSLTDHADAMSRYVSQRIAVSMIEGILIPLALLAIFWLAASKLVRIAFPPHRQDGSGTG